MKIRLVSSASIIVVILLLLSALPIQANITYGPWRDINPTQYTPDATGTLRSIYVRNGGSGSIGAGDGWAVGGDTVSGVGTPVIAHYDGFSWPITSSPIATSIYYGVNFCTSPGAPGVGLCSPNGDGSDGWLVGQNTGTSKGLAVYWAPGLTTQTTGLGDALNLTSVFMVCHSPEFSSGCPSSAGFVNGLTYAVGKNITSSTSSHGSVWAFSGDPKSSGGWVEQVVLGFPADHYNSIYMFQDSAGNLEGFAVGGDATNGGVVARLFSGGNTWSATKIGGSANELLGVFVDQTNPIDAWAVGRGGQLWNFHNGAWAGPYSPTGTSQDLYSIQLVSTSEGWIVGAGGTIVHSTTLGGSDTWIPVTQPVQTGVGVGITLLGVSFTGGGNGWADGSQGIILQTGNSGCGSAVPQPCWGGSTNILGSAQLNAVWELGSGDAWAGGLFDPGSMCCSLIHWDGIKWHRATVAPLQTTNPNIWTIYMLSSGEGWALGGNAANTVPEALLWNGQSWTGQPIAACPPGPCQPRSVFMLSGGTGGDGWAVGLDGVIWRHQSGSWLQFSQVGPAGCSSTSTCPNLNGLFINNPGAPSGTPAGWAVGNGGSVFVLTITSGIPVWTTHGIPQITLGQNLNGVYFTDSNHGWIVGASSTIVQTTDGGNSWSGGSGQVTSAASANLTSVFVDTFGTGSGNGDGWAVGDDGSASPGNVLFAHWDGVTWTDKPLDPAILAGSTATPGMSLRSVYLNGPQDGWAVGRCLPLSCTSGALSGLNHLDPLSPPIAGQQTTNTTSSSSSVVTSVSSSMTSSSSSSASTTASTTSMTTTSPLTATVVSMSVSTMTVVSTPTTTSSSTTISVSTPMVLPAIPGFPWESIIVGLMIGMAALAIVRRRKK